MADKIKIIKDISEAQAFNNCVKILESFELHIKQFEFTINYIKWLLNKFDMSYIYLEPFEDVPEDERPKNTAAFAQSQHSLISVPINDLSLTNLYKHLGYIAHELKHVADYDFYMKRLLLGTDRSFYAADFTEYLWEKSDLEKLNKDNFLYNISYYLNAHEIGARENEWFYTNLFLRLAQKHSKNPFAQKILNEQLKKSIEKSKYLDENILVFENYTDSHFFEKTKTIISREIKKTWKEFLKIKNGDINKYIAVKEKLYSLIALYPNENIAKKLAKVFKSNFYNAFSLALKADCLQMLAKTPFEFLTEKDINKFLIKRDKISDYLIKAIEPTTLAERFLLLNGSKSLFITHMNFTCGHLLEKNISQIHSVNKAFEEYYIVGINNMPESKEKKQALKKFINTTSFKLTPQVLMEYNELFNGKLCYNQEELTKQLTKSV